jgi:hypothetical protein
MAERPGTQLILKRASASRSSGEWSDDDYDVLEKGVVVGRIFAGRPQHRRRRVTRAQLPAIRFR